jgi:hypothetical protein
MLDERQEVRLQRAKQLLQNRLLEELTIHQSAAKKLASIIEQAQQQNDAKLLMPSESIAWQQRLDGAIVRHQLIMTSKEQLAQAPLVQKYQQRLKRLQGILIWQASEQFEGRLRESQKVLAQVNSEISAGKQQQIKLQTLLAEKPEFSQQRQRIEEIEQRLALQSTNNDVLQLSLITELRTLFARMLDQHIEKIQNYMVQAQLAVVRLNDQAFRKAIEDQRLSPLAPQAQGGAK